MIRLPVQGGARVWHRFAASFATLLLFALLPVAASANEITVENALTGNPSSEWDISGIGDPDIQGFSTDISVDRGQTIDFKISSASTYGIRIYRLGYYNGDGARFIADLGAGFAANVQTVPAPEPVTGIVDCGAWTVSASWAVPGSAVSGIYIALLTRDGGGSSHIAFVVRDDASHSDLLFKTSDTTWQAYNVFGGNSFYQGGAAGPPALNHASKLSYNRPFYTRGGGGPIEDWLFNAEYPMVRWLESNGYDVSYMACPDAARHGNLLTNHRVLLSVGHDEYWSADERTNFEAARNAGTHLAFFSGNEVYWKTRWEPSTDGSNTPYRTLVCYKEGTLGENNCGGKCDPLANTWTGLWRDGCAFPAADGCRPENALTGQISWDGSTGAIQVPDTFKNLRFWRNTSIATLGVGQIATLTPGTLGYEWDWQQYDASYPARRTLLSTTVLGGHTHHLSLYRHDSGALVFGAGTVQWSWGLDSHHDRASDPPSLAMQQATVNLFADMGVAPASLQAGLISAIASSDTQAPASVIGFPLAGASLPSGSAVNIQGSASDAGGGVVAGVEVSVDGGATWSAASGTTAWSYAWTPVTQGAVTIKSRAFDDTGNLEVPTGPANVIAVTVTAPAPPTCPCTAWDAGTVPGTPDGGDGNALEVGVRFKSDVDGFISGVRYYKSAANIGAHLGKLYTNTGEPKASDAFTGETASGWQEVTFTTPVAITHGIPYVASVWMPAGHYAYGPGFFAAGGVDRAPIHLLQDGVDGANGVYNYFSQGFPTSTSGSANYWVDVVFTTTGAGPDLTPPTITAISPGNGANGVAVGVHVTATFSEAMNAATIDGTTFELRTAGNALVPASVAYSPGTRTATLTPNAALDYSSTYAARVTTGIQDAAGNALATAQTWSFTTSAPPPPPPNEGPGGPILVISSATNPFSRYPVEILRNEGLNAFTAMDLSLVTPTVLAAYDVVVLGECAIGAGDVTMLSAWTNAGGTLIAFRPDAQLAPLLGLTPAAGTLANAYMKVDTASGPGVGIVGETMQFHGAADLYTLNGATAVAMLYSNAANATANPAVTTRSVGPNGGRAIAFTYDLARSVVYTRQGNPAWAGTKRDGMIEPIRSDDQFFGAAAGDVQPDWIDFTKIAIPQADEQQRLLANAILKGNLHRKPLPRFWYLPKGLKAAIVMTGDNHGDAGMAPRFDIYRTQSTPGCSVDDWDCVRATGYLYLGSTFTPAQAAFYDGLGFEVALHIDTGCARATPSQYENFVASQTAAFVATYPGLAPLVSNRNHCIAWSDWSSVAEIEAAHGIRLDTNYYYWPPGWVQNRPGMFTGSGMPMRFAKADGSLIDCYQASTEMPDESGESFPSFCDALLERAQGPEGYYGVFTTNMHFDSSPHGGSDAVVASAQAHNVPVVSAKQMLTWLDGRNGSSFGGLTWSGNQLTFLIAVGSGARNLRAMLPMLAAVGQLTTLTRDGNPVAFTTETVKGIDYAFFPADAGNYAATYLVDETAPVISAVTATPHTGGTATIAWTTDEASDSHVDYGTAPGSLGSTSGSAALVTSHSVTLSGLAQETAYHFRVRSADAVNNLATEPILSSDPLTFAMPAGPCAQDQTAADFAQGATAGSTIVTQVGDGEVTLAPAVNEEFSGSGLPAGWTSTNWVGGGTAGASGGVLTVSGAAASTSATFSGPGRSLEFVATFLADAFQNVGFATDGAFGTNWITFGTGGAGNGVYARSSNGTELLISAALLGTPHRYRIDWNALDFTFFVDGTQVKVIPVALGGSLLPIVSDFSLNGLPLAVDWLRLTDYAPLGSYTSRVFDSGGTSTWGAASWTATLPGGTTLGMFQRHGPTPTPDDFWTLFTAIGPSGSIVGGSGRYLQYRADLTTSVTTATPVLDEIEFACTSTPDLTPPVISSIVATPGPVGTTASITWTTDEPATSHVDYGLSPGALSLNASSGAFVASHTMGLTSLTPATTYYYRVTSKDLSNNSTTEPPAPASFTTSAAAPTTCAQDQSAADFAGGSLSGTAITQVADGEVTLAPGLDVDFSGLSLPAGWGSYDWPYDSVVGTATVAGGLLTVDGARANPEPFSTGPGSSLEFVATFSGDGNQHVGFGGGNHLPSGEVFNTGPWAIFSTLGGGALFARCFDNVTHFDTSIPGSWFGSPHRYRIDWGASAVDFYIDGTLVLSQPVIIPGLMRPAASDLFGGGGVVTVDWMRMTPYAPSGTFESRIHDAGSPVTWVSMNWNALTPAGTTLAMSVRTGNTPVPDGTWTSYAAVANSGDAVGGTARYLQYHAAFDATDRTRTPSLADVSVTCSACSGGPTVIADLSAVSSLNAGNGRSNARVTWSGPIAGEAVAVYRKAYGDYPLYRADHGAAPSAPATPGDATTEGWTLTGVTASGGLDAPPARGSWYYVAYVTNACSVVSGPSNRTAGTLDYQLGDVSNGVAACVGGGEAGDGVVDTADMSIFGASYGTSFPTSDDRICLDVGPTVDFGIRSRPTPDQALNFEDLVIYALNFQLPLPAGQTAPAAARVVAPAADGVRDALWVVAPEAVKAGQLFDAIVRYRGAGSVHAVSAKLAWDPALVEVTGQEGGELLIGAGGLALSPAAGTVDAAVLGSSAGGITGEGDLALVHFRARADGAPRVRVAEANARDGANQAVALELDGTPAPVLQLATGIGRVFPNPFQGSLNVPFALAKESRVTVTIFDLAGRIVRHLEDGVRTPGSHAVIWDGRTDRGVQAASGLYAVKFKAGNVDQTRRVMLIR